MNLNEQQLQQIEHYLAGQLSGTALTEFEQAMAKDKALATQVELIKEVDNALADKTAVTAFEDQLASLGKTHFPSTAIPKTEVIVKRLPFVRKQWLAAAAMIGAMFAILLAVWNISAPTSSNDLYAQHFQTYDISVERGIDTTIVPEKTALDLYEQQAYEKAIPAFQNVLQNDPQNGLLILCLGNCFLKTEQTNKAVEQFLSIAADNHYYRAAQWYLALAYLQKGDKVKAKPFLEKLAAIENGRYPEKARNLLKAL